MKVIKDYIKKLTLLGSEMANRTTFENMLNDINNTLNVNCMIIQDIRSQNNSNDQVDFIISYGGNEIAFIETKRIIENGKVLDISKLIDSKQIQKYKKHNLPILLTNYIDFIFIDRDYISDIISIARVENDKIKTDKNHEESYSIVYSWIIQLLNSSPAPISKVSILAQRLAIATQSLRADINSRLESTEDNSIKGAYLEFQDQIGITNIKDFSSSYAETIAYGLLMIRLSNNTDITKNDLISQKSIGIIQNLSIAILDCDTQIEHTINVIINIVNLIDVDSIQKELAFSVGNDKDPYIYLYEDFLQIYDLEQKKKRGVYYTPLPIVDYIVRSVDICLKEKLSIRKGLKDSRVKILDFATGTGTFILEAIRLVLNNEDKETQIQYINEHILKNFYAFEYLMAPYAVAHLKIGNYLSNITGEKAHPQILLTNTIHNTKSEHTATMLKSLQDEGKKAHKVKNEEEILAIIGNPPYSGHSANTDTHITNWDIDIKDSYMQCDDKPLGEKNPKWLNDDYVKFIRFAQWKISQVDKGIIALITNHGFLDNPTFRGMRQSLMRSFDEMYLLDLHGNSKRKETSPDGSKDENVFPIQQGVAILILIKNPTLSKKVMIQDVYGLKKDKFAYLDNHDINTTQWRDIRPDSSTKYLFKEVKMNKNYPLLLGLKEIFTESSVGIQTHRDHFAIAFTKEEIKKRIIDLCDSKLSNEYISTHYQLKETSEFMIDKVRLHFIGKDPKEFDKYIMPIDYRIFSKQWILNHPVIIDRDRKAIMQHMLKPNIGFSTVKSLSSSSFQHIFITDSIMEGCYISNRTKEGNDLFPLYEYKNTDKVKTRIKNTADLFVNDTKVINKVSNIKQEALAQIQNLYQGKDISGECLFYYIYAVLHHPSYREDFADLLRIDFPQIPFMNNYDTFDKLSKLGEELTKCHLLQSFADHPIKHNGSNQQVIEAEYRNEKLYYNKESHFDNIPQSLWDLHIGGYQVLKSWINSRKKRTLTLDETQKFEDIVCALIKAESIIEEIDNCKITS